MKMNFQILKDNVKDYKIIVEFFNYEKTEKSKAKGNKVKKDNTFKNQSN